MFSMHKTGVMILQMTLLRAAHVQASVEKSLPSFFNSVHFFF